MSVKIKKSLSFQDDYEGFNDALQKLRAKEGVLTLNFHGEFTKNEETGNTNAYFHISYEENEEL